MYLSIHKCDDLLSLYVDIVSVRNIYLIYPIVKENRNNIHCTFCRDILVIETCLYFKSEYFTVVTL